jgi:hypothetical protein
LEKPETEVEEIEAGVEPETKASVEPKAEEDFIQDLANAVKELGEETEPKEEGDFIQDLANAVEGLKEEDEEGGAEAVGELEREEEAGEELGQKEIVKAGLGEGVETDVIGKTRTRLDTKLSAETTGNAAGSTVTTTTTTTTTTVTVPTTTTTTVPTAATTTEDVQGIIDTILTTLTREGLEITTPKQLLRVLADVVPSSLASSIPAATVLGAAAAAFPSLAAKLPRPRIGETWDDYLESLPSTWLAGKETEVERFRLI